MVGFDKLLLEVDNILAGWRKLDIEQPKVDNMGEEFWNIICSRAIDFGMLTFGLVFFLE